MHKTEYDESEVIADLELDFTRWFEARFKGIQFPVQKHQAMLMAKAAYVKGMQVGFNTPHAEESEGNA